MRTSLPPPPSLFPRPQAAAAAEDAGLELLYPTPEARHALLMSVLGGGGAGASTGPGGASKGGRGCVEFHFRWPTLRRDTRTLPDKAALPGAVGPDDVIDTRFERALLLLQAEAGARGWRCELAGEFGAEAVAREVERVGHADAPADGNRNSNDAPASASAGEAAGDVGMAAAAGSSVGASSAPQQVGGSVHLIVELPATSTQCQLGASADPALRFLQDDLAALLQQVRCACGSVHAQCPRMAAASDAPLRPPLACAHPRRASPHACPQAGLPGWEFPSGCADPPVSVKIERHAAFDRLQRLAVEPGVGWVRLYAGGDEGRDGAEPGRSIWDSVVHHVDAFVQAQVRSKARSAEAAPTSQ